MALEVSALLDTIQEQKQTIDRLNSQTLPKPESKVKEIVNQIAKNDSVDDFTVATGGSATFGTSWPSYPAKGDLFLKVDSTPNKLYKWNSRKWVEIDRGQVDKSLVYDQSYIDWLILQIRRGHTEFDALTDLEQEQIKARIMNND